MCECVSTFINDSTVSPITHIHLIIHLPTYPPTHLHSNLPIHLHTYTPTYLSTYQVRI